MLGAAAIVLMAAVAGIIALCVIAMFVRAVIWLVLLPLKLLFGLILLPLLLVKFVLAVVFGVILLPLLVVSGIVAAFALAAALAVPLAPFLVFAAVVFWLLKKDRPASTLPARTV